MGKKYIQFVSALALASIIVLGSAVTVAASGADASGVPGQKIIVFSDSFQDKAAQETMLREFGEVRKSIPLVNGWSVVLKPGVEKDLGKRAEVLHIENDAVVSIQIEPPGQTMAVETLPCGVDRINADMVWDKDHDFTTDPGANTGIGVKVAVIDTGIDLDHPDLIDNIKGGFNAIDPAKAPDDDNGHGTHVAGIIAGMDNNDGVIGVAPKVHLYAVKVISAAGSGYVSDIIEGVQWAIDNDMQVINMSLGTSSDSPLLHEVIAAAEKKGIVIVAAAGNNGPGDNTVSYPGKYPEVLAVSTLDDANAIANFSSRGSETGIAAPGVKIYSTYKDGGYKSLSGTSMASPHVVGVAALVIASGIKDENGDGLINDEVRARLEKTAEDLGDTGKDALYGHGLVNAEKAAAVPVVSPPPPRPGTRYRLIIRYPYFYLVPIPY